MIALRILLRWPLRAWLHRRCLRRIALLEKALGIWPPYELEAVDRYDGIEASIEFRPGMRWAVDDARDVVIFPAPTNHVEIINHKYKLAETLLYGESS